jgi:DNA-binding beta-propeller fold protein YncE
VQEEILRLASGDALLAGAADLAVAEGGSQIYVAAPDAEAVALLRMGAAGAFDSIIAAAIKDASALSSFSKPACLALDTAGDILAVGTQGDDALYLFAREAPEGSLSLASRIDKTAFDAFGSLSDPCSLAFSPGGTSLFVLSYYGKAVFRLDKDPVSGAFSPVAGAKSGLGGVTGFATPKRLTVAPDGSLLAIAGGGAADGLALFDVSAPGALAFQGALLPSAGIALPSRPSALAFSPDGRFLALAADGYLSIFRAGPDD